MKKRFCLVAQAEYYAYIDADSEEEALQNWRSVQRSRTFNLPLQGVKVESSEEIKEN